MPPTPPDLLPKDGTAHYWAEILPKHEADALLQALMAGLEWQQDELLIYGKRITTKRKTAWHGDNPIAYTYSHQTRLARPWTPELLHLKALAEAHTGATYNACLLNLYHNGAEGMGWHADNEDSIVAGSSIASISLGAERRFDFRHRASSQKVQLMLANGSLLEMKGETQTHWQHALPKSLRIQQPRINLTFRLMKANP